MYTCRIFFLTEKSLGTELLVVKVTSVHVQYGVTYYMTQMQTYKISGRNIGYVLLIVSDNHKGNFPDHNLLYNQGLAVSIATEDGSSAGYYRAITINSSSSLPQFNESESTTDKFLALCKPDGIVS